MKKGYTMGRYTSIVGKIYFKNEVDYAIYKEKVGLWTKVEDGVTKLIGSTSDVFDDKKYVVSFQECDTDSIEKSMELLNVLKEYDIPYNKELTVVRYVSDDGCLESGEFANGDIYDKEYNDYQSYSELLGEDVMCELFTTERIFNKYIDDNIYDGTPLDKLRELLYQWQVRI